MLIMDSAVKERFINSVRSRPLLYDGSDRNYKDSQMKDNVWSEIATEFGIVDGNIAKGEWKKIRDNFRDALKRKSASRSGQATVQISQYKYYKQMCFLIPFISNRSKPRDGGGLAQTLGMDPQTPVASNQEPEPPVQVACKQEPEDEAEAMEADLEGRRSEPPAKKMKPSSDRVLEYLMETNTKREERAQERDRRRAELHNAHPLDHFFKTMLETTKLMPERWQLQVKRKVFNIVSDAEEEVMGSYEAMALQGHNVPMVDSSPSDSPRNSATPSPLSLAGSYK